MTEAFSYTKYFFSPKNNLLTFLNLDDFSFTYLFLNMISALFSVKGFEVVSLTSFTCKEKRWIMLCLMTQISAILYVQAAISNLLLYFSHLSTQAFGDQKRAAAKIKCYSIRISLCVVSFASKMTLHIVTLDEKTDLKIMNITQGPTSDADQKQYKLVEISMPNSMFTKCISNA